MSLLQNSNAISSGGYNLESSLRFRSSASAYLSRTPTTSSNKRTWTFSVWIKNPTATERLLTAYVDGDNRTEINLLGSGQLAFYSRKSASTSANIYTNAILRDPSAWYHIIVAVDLTNTSVKFYINGELQSTITTETTTNSDTLFNDSSYTMTIGARTTLSNFFDGYMTEVNFVDGQALTPSDFGEYDDTTGVWKPKEYTGTYGTNGFYLPMKETQQATGFNTVLYTGNGTSQSITGVGFEPDFVWLKERSSTSSHFLNQAVDGTVRFMQSDTTIAEVTNAQVVGSFDSDGFSVGNSGGSNQSGQTYVAWCWDAGSSTVSNTDGTITSSVRANPATGFSIVTYTGNTTAGATIGHGLDSAPDMIIIKDRDTVDNWAVYHGSLGGGNASLFLEATTAVNTSLNMWNSTAPSSSVITLGDRDEVNRATAHVAYCFAEVAGFSKFGSYTGNGSTSGPTVTTGFRPAFVMLKIYDGTGSASDQWAMLDNTRSTSNTTDHRLFADSNQAESTGGPVDFLDDGFQLKNSFGNMNASGKNYIYMAFADTRDAQFNFDASGNKNNWTANNINSNASSETTYDIMNDVPTLTDEDTANFCTLNPLVVGDGGTMFDGNLSFTTPTSTRGFHAATIGINSGKWYWEVSCSASTYNSTNRAAIGYKIGNERSSYVISGTDGDVAGMGFYIGDTVGFAFDADNGTVENFINGVSNATVTGIDMTKTWFPIGADAHTAQNGTVHWNFGQRPFAYTPPTGYKKLNTYNLPDSTIVDGSQYMNPVLYTGNSSTNAITGVGFSPDFTWIKRRSGANAHQLYDTVRGAGYVLKSDSTSAEAVETAFNSFDADGFEVDGGSGSHNLSGESYVAWNWRASDSSAVSNTDGTITSTVSANTDSGFSVVTYTGNATTGATVGHGLGAKPAMVILKNRDTVGGWEVWHQDLGSESYFIRLNETSATYTGSTNRWTAFSNSVITLGNNGTTNGSGNNLVAYCFAEVEGFSKFGSYTGNGSTDGPFVYTGFRPAFLITKRTDSAGGWHVFDSVRGDYNPNDPYLYPHLSNAEFGGVDTYDLLSNGFKNTRAGSDQNASGGTYIYMAFAENPFKHSLAR